MTFWNDVAALPELNLIQTNILDNCQDAVLYEVKNRAYGVHRQLKKEGYAITLGFDHMPIRNKAALEFVIHPKEAKAFESLDVCPRTGPTTGNALCTYHHWFAAQQYQVKRLFGFQYLCIILKYGSISSPPYCYMTVSRNNRKTVQINANLKVQT